MIRYQCDRCGAALSASDAGRFIVRLEIYAAAGPLDLSELSEHSKESVAEVIESLSRADPDDVEDRTYRNFRFDVCDACRQDLLKKPLG